MPELPDVTIYIERLEALVQGQPLERARIKSPFLVRTVDPPIQSLEGKRVEGFRRLGKRIVFCFEGEVFLSLHLMISGRLWWKERAVAIAGKRGLAAFDFPNGSLLLTEASTQKRASIHVVQGDELARLDRGGLEPLLMTEAQFRERLVLENRTLKRALTDPRLFSGIGNAYSDEILHAARLSPVSLTRSLDRAAQKALYRSIRKVLKDWIERTREEVGEGFPEHVTAFREGMVVHGRYGKPCPTCGDPVQRIRHAANEVNYCARCQTQGKLLADRGLSRLLRKDWPRTLEELEELKTTRTVRPESS